MQALYVSRMRQIVDYLLGEKLLYTHINQLSDNSHQHRRKLQAASIKETRKTKKARIIYLLPLLFNNWTDIMGIRFE